METLWRLSGDLESSSVTKGYYGDPQSSVGWEGPPVCLPSETTFYTENRGTDDWGHFP